MMHSTHFKILQLYGIEYKFNDAFTFQHISTQIQRCNVVGSIFLIENIPVAD